MHPVAIYSLIDPDYFVKLHKLTDVNPNIDVSAPLARSPAPIALERALEIGSRSPGRTRGQLVRGHSERNEVERRISLGSREAGALPL